MDKKVKTPRRNDAFAIPKRSVVAAAVSQKQKPKRGPGITIASSRSCSVAADKRFGMRVAKI